MKKLEIQLQEKFRSFKKDFSLELMGDLIIISGVNGSGKSQLASIIKKQDSNKGAQDQINAVILLDGVPLESKHVLRKNLEDSFNIENISASQPNQLQNATNQFWNRYSRVKTNLARPEIAGFLNSYNDGLAILRSEYPANSLTSLSQDQVSRALSRSPKFVWRSDDIFTNTITQRFYSYVQACKTEHATASEEKRKPNIDRLGQKPWEFMNELLSELGIDYRFKNEYTIDIWAGPLDEIPNLHAISKTGELIDEDVRLLSDLSDGEKSLIQLAFAVSSNFSSSFTKVLLLDEYDATFNPSLTEKFYNLIDKYFIKSGVVVIIISHSPTTISLAPSTACFYEAFTENQNNKRVLAVQPYMYAELSLANAMFVKRISDQHQRIEDIETDSLSDLENKPLLFVEDNYTEIYKVAYLMINDISFSETTLDDVFEKEAPFKIHPKSGKNNLYGMLNGEKFDEFTNRRVLGLFDFDDAYMDFRNLKEQFWGREEGDDKSGHFRVRTDYPNMSALVLPVPLHRSEQAASDQKVRVLDIEQYFTDEVLEAIIENPSKDKLINGYSKITITNKSDFWRKALTLEKSDFKSFEVLFKRIEALLGVTSTEK